MEISGRHRPGRRRCSGDRGGGGTGDGSAGQRGGRVALAGQAALDRAYADTKATVWRWRTAYQNDFAARMTWAIMPRFTDANHRPTLRLNGVGGLAPVEIAACYGEAVKLSAAGSRDVDGQPLTFRWWRYSEVTGRLTVKSVFDPADGPEATVTVALPSVSKELPVASAFQVHVILEGKDNGTPALTSYRRAVISVPDLRAPEKAGKTCPR